MIVVNVIVIANLVGSVLGGVILECPKRVEKAPNDVVDFFDYYDEWFEEHREYGLKSFRDRAYGGRGDTYNEMKEKAARFKVEAFGRNLREGDIIFETACGEGFNLLLTLEILDEKLGLKNITAYGIDYLSEQVDIARKVFASEGRNGTFCRGDSTNLDFISPSTFDIGYCGCIDPLADPLHLSDESVPAEDRYELSRERCDSDDPEVQAIVEAEQRAQEDWAAKFVTELIRIVKPGKPIIIEDVANPLCSEDGMHDWGGISSEWWKGAIAKYGWDVDPDSLKIYSGPWYWNRYNVLMRRKSADTLAGDEL